MSNAQSIDRLTSDQMRLHDLVDIVDRDAAVPHPFGIDDSDRTELARIEAAASVCANARLQLVGVDQFLEAGADLVGALFAARSARILGISLVRADEDVMLISHEGVWGRGSGV